MNPVGDEVQKRMEEAGKEIPSPVLHHPPSPGFRLRIASTRRADAAGECFDKVGRMLGLAHPAGAVIDRLAGQGNPKAFDFPRPMLDDANDDFSFSGLKTPVRYFLRDKPRLLDDAQKVRDLRASMQAAIVEVLVAKTIRAARKGCYSPTTQR